LLAKGGLKTPEEGSWNQLWAATSKDNVSGQYYEPVGILEKRTSKSKDEELREELWGWTALQLKDYTI
jgi:retinol dehydrogenase-12